MRDPEYLVPLVCLLGNVSRETSSSTTVVGQPLWVGHEVRSIDEKQECEDTA